MSAFRRKPSMVRLPIGLAIAQPSDRPRWPWWRLRPVKQADKPQVKREREIPAFLLAEDVQ